MIDKKQIAKLSRKERRKLFLGAKRLAKKKHGRKGANMMEATFRRDILNQK